MPRLSLPKYRRIATDAYCPYRTSCSQRYLRSATPETASARTHRHARTLWKHYDVYALPQKSLGILKNTFRIVIHEENGLHYARIERISGCGRLSNRRSIAQMGNQQYYVYQGNVV